MAEHRGSGIGRGGHERTKTHCAHGHPYDAENTYYNSRGHRFCRECQRLHARAYRRARPHRQRTLVSVDERVWAKVVAGQNGCLIWTGATTAAGYGQISIGGRKGTKEYVHRWAWSERYGPIPQGTEIDHVCHSRDATCVGGNRCIHRRCINPEHLEPVTHLENVRRGRAGDVLVGTTKANAEKTHCPRGHPYEPPHLHIYRGRRLCMTCITERSRHDRVRYRGFRRKELMVPERCEECGGARRLDAAHYDYVDLMHVRWLCRSCHVTWDNSRRRQ